MANQLTPTIYKAYTKHMKRVKPFTYRTGYEVIDQALVKDYYRKTTRQIASDLNELETRVIYRINVLVDLNILPVRKNEAKRIAAMLNAS